MNLDQLREPYNHGLSLIPPNVWDEGDDAPYNHTEEWRKASKYYYKIVWLNTFCFWGD